MLGAADPMPQYYIPEYRSPQPLVSFFISIIINRFSSGYLNYLHSYFNQRLSCECLFVVQQSRILCCLAFPKAGVHKSWVLGCHGDYILCDGMNIYGSSVWNLFRVTPLAPRMLRCFVGLWKICEPLS